MYQLDSWYTVFFELLLVGFSLYNSLRMTKWWNTVAEGTAIGVNGAKRVPSVADLYGIRTSEKKSMRSCGKNSHSRHADVVEAGDGIDVR